MPIKARQVSVENAAFFAKGLFLTEDKRVESSCASLVEKVVYPWSDKLKIESAKRGESSESSSSRTSSSTSSSRSTIPSDFEGEVLLEERQCSQSCSNINPVVGVPSSQKARNSRRTKSSEKASVQKEKESMNEEEESDEEALVAARKRTAAFLYPKSERQRQRRQQQESRNPQSFSLPYSQPSKPKEEPKKKDHLGIHHTSHSTFPTGVIRNAGNILEHSKTSPLPVRPENSRTRHSSSGLHSSEEKRTHQIRSNTHAFDLITKERSAESAQRREEETMSNTSFAASPAAADTALAIDSDSTSSNLPTEIRQPSVFPSTSPASFECNGDEGAGIHSTLPHSSFLRQKAVSDVNIATKAATSSKPLDPQCEDASQELSAVWCFDGNKSKEKGRNQACEEGGSRIVHNGEEESEIPFYSPPFPTETANKGSTSWSEMKDVEHNRVFVASAELRKAFAMAASRVSTQRSYSAQSVKRFSTRSEQRPSSSVLANPPSWGVSSSPQTTYSRSSPGNVLLHAFGGLPMSMEEVAALQVTERNDKRLHADNPHQGVGGPQAEGDSSKGEVSSSSGWFRTPEALVEEATARLDRFLEGVRWLEKLVRDYHFQTSVANFFYRHHKLFLSHVQSSSLCDSPMNKPADRSRDGEEGKRSKNGVESYSHEEFAVFSEFSQHIAKAVYQWLSSHVHDFDEEEFAEDLFDTSVGTQNDSITTMTPMNEADPPMNVASYPAWRIILSISSFTCFVDWMVDFIEEEFQLNEQEDVMGTVVAGTRGLKALLASAYRTKKKNKTDLRMPLQEIGVETKGEGQKSDTTATAVTTSTTHSFCRSTTGDVFHGEEQEEGGDALKNAIMSFSPFEEEREECRMPRDTTAASAKCRIEEEVLSPPPSTIGRGVKAEALRKQVEWEEKAEEKKKRKEKGASRVRSCRKGNASADRRSATALLSSSKSTQKMTSTGLLQPAEESSISSLREDNSMAGDKREEDEGEKHESRPSHLAGSSGAALLSSVSPSFRSFPVGKFPPPIASSKMLSSSASLSSMGLSYSKKNTEREKRKGSTAYDAPQKEEKKVPPQQGKHKRKGTKDSQRSLSCEPPACPPPSSLRLSLSSAGSGVANAGGTCNSDVVGIRGRQSRHLPPLLASTGTTSFCTSSIPSTSLTTTVVVGSTSEHGMLSFTSPPSSPSTLCSAVRTTDHSVSAGAAPSRLEGSQKGSVTTKHRLSTLPSKWRTEDGKVPPSGMDRTRREEHTYQRDALPSKPPLLPSHSREEEGGENKKCKSVKRKQQKTTDAKVLGENVGGRVPSPLPPPPSF